MTIRRVIIKTITEDFPPNTCKSNSVDQTLPVYHHAREARAPYIAAELRNPIYAYIVNGPEAAPNKMAAPTIHRLLSTTMQTGRSFESSQMQDCSSGNLSKAFHTSTATVTAVRHELCLRKAKKNHNMNKPGSDGRRALLFCALQADFVDFSLVCYVGLVYPRPHFGLLSRGEANRDEPVSQQIRSYLIPVPPEWIR